MHSAALTHLPENTRRVLERLGRSANAALPILLPIPDGEKGPRFNRWQAVTATDFADPDFEVLFPCADPRNPAGSITKRTARYAALFEGANIGVLQGAPSGGLVSIDIDTDADVACILEPNPWLAATLRTRGARGCNFWLWIDGECPKLHKDLCWKKPDGSADKSRPFGEWRSTGGQTVIWGRHPSGCEYQWIVDAEPLRVKFSDIIWPENLHLPWLNTPAAPVPTKPVAIAGEGLQAELEAELGPAWRETKKGGLDLNPPFWAALLARRRRLLFEPAELRFYRYDAERGLWIVETEDRLRWLGGELLQEVARQTSKSELTFKRSNNTLAALVSLARGAVEKRDAFLRPTDPATGLPRLFLHVQNGMVLLDRPELQLEDFSPDFFSRNQLAVSLDPDGACPRFENELLAPALDTEDIELLQRWAGMLVVGVNLAQKIMILTGTAGGGKSTLINVLAQVIGRANVGELRTAHLHERFEIFRLVGRTLLVGADVPGDFLESDGAYVLKALVGGDLLDAEPKQGNEVVQLRGEFNAAVLSNTRLRVRLDGDVDAWRRRLMIVPYSRPRVKHPDPQFATKLLVSEGPGILNWVGSSRVDLQACKLEYSIVSPK